MNFQPQSIEPTLTIEQTDSALIGAIFRWMFVGLMITTGLAMFIANTPAALNFVVASPGLFIGLMFAEVGLVVWLAVRVYKMSPAKAKAIFFAYAALNGVTLAPLGLAYTGESIASAFLTAGAMFGVMAVWGSTTKRDLTAMGSFLMMGLIGMVIAMVVNFFLKSSAMGFIISAVGVIVFTGLTAYDVQKFKRLGQNVRQGEVAFEQLAIYGALELYLDLINLFLSLLSLMGDRD